MKGMTLEDLVSGLEKSAGFEEMKAKAEEKPKTDDDGEGNTSKDKDNKDGKKEEKKEEQEKSAAFKSGAELAREIMEKVASIKTEQTNKDTEMNKQASDAGKALAQSLLTKLANVGDANTGMGYADGAVPNKTQADLAAQVSEHANSFQATPGTDGAGNGGTINQIFDAIVADAQGSTNAVSMVQSASAPAEGAINRQAPNQVPQDESREKMAAAISLINSGVDFDDAVAMVKAASDELEAEHQTHVKQAALNQLLESGVDFDLAIAMVKQASAAPAAAKAVAPGGREKKAALDQLIQNGVDYDQAVNLVENKYQELYGN